MNTFLLLWLLLIADENFPAALAVDVAVGTGGVVAFLEEAASNASKAMTRH